MKNADSPLDRLLRAAAQSRPAVDEELPFGFTTRVVAGWLAATGAERIGLDAKLQAMWFRRALLCAVAVMAITVGWSFKTDTAPNDEMAIAGYDPTADLP
jgi:hypothetical protein